MEEEQRAISEADEDYTLLLVYKIIEIAGNDFEASEILNELVRRFQNLNEGDQARLEQNSSLLLPSHSVEIVNMLEQLGLY